MFLNRVAVQSHCNYTFLLYRNILASCIGQSKLTFGGGRHDDQEAPPSVPDTQIDDTQIDNDQTRFVPNPRFDEDAQPREAFPDTLSYSDGEPGPPTQTAVTWNFTVDSLLDSIQIHTQHVI